MLCHGGFPFIGFFTFTFFSEWSSFKWLEQRENRDQSLDSSLRRKGGVFLASMSADRSDTEIWFERNQVFWLLLCLVLQWSSLDLVKFLPEWISAYGIRSNQNLWKRYVFVHPIIRKYMIRAEYWRRSWRPICSPKHAIPVISDLLAKSQNQSRDSLRTPDGPHGKEVYYYLQSAKERPLSIFFVIR